VLKKQFFHLDYSIHTDMEILHYWMYLNDWRKRDVRN